MDHIEHKDSGTSDNAGAGTPKRKRRVEFFNEDDAINAKNNFYGGLFQGLGGALALAIAAGIGLLLQAACGKTESNLDS